MDFRPRIGLVHVLLYSFLRCIVAILQQLANRVALTRPTWHAVSGSGNAGSPEKLNLLIVTDSIDEVRDAIVECYRTRCWDAWKRSYGARMDADPPGGSCHSAQPGNGGCA